MARGEEDQDKMTESIVDAGGGSGDDATAAAAVEEEPSTPVAKPVARMRNLYTAALSYNGYTITDGALRLIVLLHAADLGYVSARSVARCGSIFFGYTKSTLLL